MTQLNISEELILEEIIGKVLNNLGENEDGTTVTTTGLMLILSDDEIETLKGLLAKL